MLIGKNSNKKNNKGKKKITRIILNHKHLTFKHLASSIAFTTYNDIVLGTTSPEKCLSCQECFYHSVLIYPVQY